MSSRPGKTSRLREAVTGNLAELARAAAAIAVTGGLAAMISFVAVRLAESGQRDTAVILVVLAFAVLADLVIEWGVQSVRSVRPRRAVR
ncbi:hypothetical protein [Actinocrispum wychmicini]|uniref:Uncharacterized protein n=1 Tax=Actinocrispum wychmicini TaxID=1213861 RepID=A0A4R2JKT2_9PSEU|nr:hypothetical protein [Actinocrispum wychmicini]TCO57189.1 hypothetical protein EV192_106666 [Actinocrispum wychmicini]